MNEDKTEEEIAPLSDDPNPYEIGDYGDHVKEQIQNLTKLGFGNFPKVPSKTYGKVTANVVKEFQEIYSLTANGIADEKTLRTIQKIIKDTTNIESRFEQQVFVLVNKERVKRSIPPLKQNNKVAKIAREHSIYMDKIFFMLHSEWRDNLPDNGLNYSVAGENVAMGYTSPKDVMKGWMNSPGHKKISLILILSK